MAPSPPAYWHVPEGSIFTIADEVADLMRAIGYTVEEPEVLALRAMLPQKPNDTWAGLMSAVIAPRQNIKTASMIGSAMHDTFEQGLDVVWTAHEFKTSTDAFNDFQAIIEGDDALAADVLKVRTANGDEGFDLRNGANLRIVARSGKSGRGFTKVGRLYLDEGLYLTPKMLGAITPAMAAAPNAHIVVASSPGILTSEVLREIRRRGRSLSDPSLGYVEWTSERALTPDELALPLSQRPSVRPPCVRADCLHAPETPGCALDDEGLWWRGNPALDRRIPREFLREQRKVLAGPSLQEFMREHMGWWEDPPTEDDVASQIPADAWAARLRADAVAPEGSRVAFGVCRSWDRERIWIGAAALLPDGGELVTLVPWDDKLGLVNSPVEWLASRRAHWNPVAIGGQIGSSPEADLIQQMQEDHRLADITQSMTGTDVGIACGTFYDAATKGPLVHIGQEQLDNAIKHAVVRAFGDVWVWDLKASPVDAAGLKAVTIARHLLDTTPATVAPNIW